MKRIKKLLFENKNEQRRNQWIKDALKALAEGTRILDAGAGELRWKPDCSHLKYVSQDFCQYAGDGDGKGLQMGDWDTSKIDIVCDIVKIPEPDSSFDAILCAEVFEHIPNPLLALKEFSRLLKPGGKLILTAPFASLVHFAPYHFSTGFSRYWYEHHLPESGFEIEILEPNGDWFDYCHQEIARLGPAAKKYREPLWPLAMLVSLIGILFFKLRGQKKPVAQDLACFGWHCLARKN
jgi:ubiquinone/menaquinone biosynthesis C-methylase UbiE